MTMNAALRTQTRASSRIFSAIPRSELEVLGEMMRTESFGAGSVVAEGEPADCVFVIAAGTLSVYLHGATTPMRTLGPGDVLGEYGMVTGAVRSVPRGAVRAVRERGEAPRRSRAPAVNATCSA